ncbi:hypothetical protein Tco_0712044 [Tanacetum coccineum]
MVDRRRRKRKWSDDLFSCHNPFESFALVERQAQNIKRSEKEGGYQERERGRSRVEEGEEKESARGERLGEKSREVEEEGELGVRGMRKGRTGGRGEQKREKEW